MCATVSKDEQQTVKDECVEENVDIEDFTIDLPLNENLMKVLPPEIWVPKRGPVCSSLPIVINKFPVPKQISNVVSNGMLYDPAKLHYGDGFTDSVYCDMCTKIITNKPCYGLDNLDVCMDCYELIKEKIDKRLN